MHNVRKIYGMCNHVFLHFRPMTLFVSADRKLQSYYLLLLLLIPSMLQQSGATVHTDSIWKMGCIGIALVWVCLGCP